MCCEIDDLPFEKDVSLLLEPCHTSQMLQLPSYISNSFQCQCLGDQIPHLDDLFSEAKIFFFALLVCIYLYDRSLQAQIAKTSDSLHIG